MRSVVGVIAGAALLVGVAPATGAEAAGATAARTGAAPAGWSTFRDQQHGISISYPRSWQAARKTLTPALVDPVVPVALGTYALEPEQSGECDIVPQRALDALGPRDAFIAVYVFDGQASWKANTKRPKHFSTHLPWYRGQIQCTENVRGSVGQLTFADHGLNLAVLVAVGLNASATRRHQIYRILDTLTVGAQQAGAASLPSGSVTHQRWTLVPKSTAGLGEGSSFDSLASNGDSMLLAGARSVGRLWAEWQAAIWRTDDGVHWTEATHPSVAGEVFSAAMDGDVGLAIGGQGLGVSTFVWRSEDDGRTWNAIADGADIFGKPAPQMGRPSVSQLVRYNGWWVASGGGSDGYAAIWVSRDGTNWQQTLDSQSAGSVSLAEGPRGSLFAYSYATTGWRTHDPTHWGRPQTVATPDRFYLSSVAPGATTAFAGNFDRHDVPTPLLRSADRAHTWKKDDRFLGAFPNARVWTITRAAGRWVATGWSDTPNHSDAWISVDRRTWSALPHELYGGIGGTLSLVAALHGRIVLIGTAPELDRYYAYNVRSSSTDPK